MSTATHTATVVTRAELAEKARRAPVRTFNTYGAIAAVIGAVVFAWALSGGLADRAWQAYHTDFVFWTVLAQALVVFAATQKLAKGHWAGLMIRFAEAAVAFQFVAVVLFIGLFLGRFHLFGWLRGVPRDYLGSWFTTGPFFARNGFILLLLAWLSWRFVRRDVAPDVRELAEGRPIDPDAHEKGLISREAAILVLAFAFGYTLLGFDLVVSLGHKWMSNLYGAFYFMGGFLGALGSLAIMSTRAASDDGARRPAVHQAAARSCQAAVRLHRVLGLPDVVAISGDLVRQHARGNVFRMVPPVGPVEARGSYRLRDGVRDSVFSGCSAPRPRNSRPRSSGSRPSASWGSGSSATWRLCRP